MLCLFVLDLDGIQDTLNIDRQEGLLLEIQVDQLAHLFLGLRNRGKLFVEFV